METAYECFPKELSLIWTSITVEKRPLCPLLAGSPLASSHSSEQTKPEARPEWPAAVWDAWAHGP